MPSLNVVVPIHPETRFYNSVLDSLNEEMVFVPPHIPYGHFPTPAELREIIHKLAYKLEENREWWVTSEKDHTEIWFKGKQRKENSPIEFSFHRGSIIVLDVMQAVVNQCGSFMVVGTSGVPMMLLVPNTLFPVVSPSLSGFVKAFSQRVPLTLEHLTKASLEDTLFLLSQIRQAQKLAQALHLNELSQRIQTGLTVYSQLVNHADARVRYMAADLIATFRPQ